MVDVHRVTVFPRGRPPHDALDVERDRLAAVWRVAHAFGSADLHAVGVWAEASNVTLVAALDEMRRP